MSSRRRRARRVGGTSAGTIVLRVAAVFAVVFLLIVAAAAVAAGATVSSYLKDLPTADNPNAFKVAEATMIYSADHKLLARFYLENRTVVPISEMSSDLANGVVAIEDSRFYVHNGVDPRGILRAVFADLSRGNKSQGASTIDQQYIRNTILLNERTSRTLARKIREAYLAMEFDKLYTKQQILQMYLNTIYFGEGAYGAEAASETYFSKHAKDLTLAQAALLAGLPQSPSGLDPYVNPKGALERRTSVLDAMLVNGYITQTEHDKAVAEPIKLHRKVDPLEGIYAAPYFVSYVRQQLQQQYSPAQVFKGGLTVYTTINMKMQKQAERAAATVTHSKSAPEVALVAIDPRNGQIKAMVGGRNYLKNKFNLAAQAHRQPGSSFKTFVLTTAIDEGIPATYQIDSSSPAIIPTKPRPWVVNNDEGSGHGMVSLDEATALSINCVYARLIWSLGAKKVALMARRMGIQTPLPNYPSIALGSKNCTPLEMASAYGTLATEGVHYPATCITKIVDPNDQVIYQLKPHGTRAIRPEVAYAVTNTLKGVLEYGTASGQSIGRPAAGKTGTSQNFRDAWFVGYTPQLVTAVWSGYTHERTIYWNGSHAFGGTLAAPVWNKFMRAALSGQPRLNFASQSSPHYSTSKLHVLNSGRSSSPKIVGLSLGSATSKLQNAGYTYSVKYVTSNSPKGTVVGTSAHGGTIVILVSSGPAPKPKPKPKPTGGGTGGGGGNGGGGSGGTTQPAGP